MNNLEQFIKDCQELGIQLDEHQKKQFLDYYLFRKII